MKSFNYFAMSLAAAAMVSFASCSSNDDLAGNGGSESKVDGFYMTLSVQTPTDNGGSRTALKNDYKATEAESALTSGTFYLVDAAGNIKFQKDFTKEQLEAKKATFQIAVENVAAGATYKAYFLANAKDAKPWVNEFTATDKFAKPYDTDTKFAMFNQNDATVDGNAYTVVFTNDNKNSKNPAKIKYADEKEESAIKIERLAARIDEPTSNATVIKAYDKKDATDAEKKAMEDAVKKVKSVELKRYAITNAANKSFIMQKWDSNNLLIPNDITYYQPNSEFGTATKLENDKFFAAADKTSADDAQKDYVFENNSKDNATAIYFEYKVTLKDTKDADFEDGTFYRYNNVIYKSFAEIFTAYAGVDGLFNGATAKELKDELTEAKDPTKVDANVPAKKDVESKLDAFRQKYDIEVFNEGKTYYKQIIQDQYIGYANAIQRNSVYQLTVNNIFNVGAQVPNGTPDTEGLFYLDVTVSVNPWVLNIQDDVELK